MKSILASLLSAAALAGCVSDSGKPPRGVQPQPMATEFVMQQAVVVSPADWAAPVVADLYIPKGAGPFPGVLMVHGGGWDGRDRSDMDGISKKLARRGYVVANVDYRLAPGALYPAQLADMRVTIKWLKANATALKLDAAQIGGWGYSAGAHLVALTALDKSDPQARLQAVVGGGMPSNFLKYPKSPIITKFIGASYQEKPETWVAASPISHIAAGDPPMFLYHGTWDRLVHAEDSVEMKQALDQAGVPAELYQLRGLGHIATFLFGGSAENAGIDFLDRYLRAAP